MVPDDDGWRVEREGQKPAVASTSTQAQADEKGRSTARRSKVEYNLHNRKGQVRQKHSYGRDPQNIKG